MSRSNDGCDEDFISPEPGSKLSMIFSGGHDQPSSDLKYIPPRQPQPRMSDGPENPNKSSDSANRVLFATTVELYAYKEKAHKSQGRVMCCIIKDQHDRNFTMLLYRSKHHPLTQTKIHSGFTVMLQPNNYATFSDDNSSKWAVHIQGEKFKEFLSQIGICRAVAAYHEAPSISPNVVQNLSLGEGASIQEGDTIKLVYCSWNVQGGRKGSMVENERDFKLKLTKIAELWQMGLIGAQVNMHRIIFVPNKMPNVIPLIAHEVIVEKIRKKTVSKSLSQLDFKDKPSLSSKPSDSSEPNTPSAFSKEALRSRMARVGQPLLPPKNFQNNLVVDSECENEEARECSPNRSICSSVEDIGANPPYISTKCDKTFGGLVTSSHLELQTPSQSPFSTVPYNAPASHGPIVAYSVPYPSLHPTPHNPSDPVMTLLLSESRSQNTELRIALSKVSDKVEEIHSKVKTIDDKPPVSPRLEPLTAHKPNPQELLRDITAIVNENETLKASLRQKESKCEELTVRTADVVHKNQKLLEEKTELLGRLNDFNDSTKKELKDFLKIKEDTDKLYDEIDQLKKQNKALQADLKSKEECCESKEQDTQLIKRLQDENESSHQVNKTLEAKILQLKSVHQALTAEKNRLDKENKDELERTKDKLGIEIKKLRAEIRSEKEFSEGRLDDMKKCFESDMAMLKGKYEQELQEERLRGEANLEKSTLSITESIELREKLNKLNRETDNLTNELHEIKCSKTQLEKELFEAKGTLEINTKKLNSKINLLSDEKLCIITELEAIKNKNANLEKEYQELNKKKTSSNSLPNESTNEFVKQIMNAVYREAKKTFDATKTYNGKDVVQLLLTVIRDTTLVHLDQCKPVACGKSPEKRDSLDNARGTPTSRSGANTPQTPRHVSSNPFISDARGSSSCFDDVAKEEDHKAEDSHTPRESWQEAAAPPPPPPLFSDSEDDNWLS